MNEFKTRCFSIETPEKILYLFTLIISKKKIKTIIIKIPYKQRTETFKLYSSRRQQLICYNSVEMYVFCLMILFVIDENTAR